MPIYRISPNFNSHGADIVFQSSDSLRFHVHAKNLEVSAGAFPPIPPKSENIKGLIVADGECVSLSEPEAVLEVLFAFMYPQRHPDLEDLPFELVSAIAEAAEKYEVYPAMNVCRRRMRDFISTNPVEVCLYGARHSYDNVVTCTAQYAIFVPLKTVVPLLPARLVVPWIDYLNSWVVARDRVLRFSWNQHHYSNGLHSAYVQNNSSCSSWRVHPEDIIRKSAITSDDPAGIRFLVDVDKTFQQKTEIERECCRKAWIAWHNIAKGEIEKMPSFVEMIKVNTRM
ncbi:hypothetical protein FA15DRAFT_704830 [Coprinopsis marcescibilis]|uniref:BTB domain-containing protein n=1 Tax=Coprinopsis marcescibilis TaxID=230819 RepID=A0A5C3KUS1_COPMA|nr:hypothetical protein FA15DRAFT_704830 [Coprinopsis marcescibilis]